MTGGPTSKGVGHTAGPWRVSVDGVRVFSTTRTEWMVADCAPLGACPANMEANARLIAAAPELLEALERLIAAHDRGPPGHMVWAAGRDAIAKAKGGAS